MALVVLLTEAGDRLITEAGDGLAIEQRVGDLNVTLGDATLVSGAGVAISATLSRTLGSISLGSDGSVKVSGSLSKTLDDAALASVAGVLIAASFNVTLGAASLVAAGVVGIRADLAKTLDNATLNSAGVAPISASANITLDPVILSSAGVVGVKADAAITLGSVSLDSAGGVLIEGDLAQTLGGLALVAAAENFISAAANITLEDLTLEATGGAPAVVCDLDVTFEDVALNSDGQVIVEASVAIELAPVGLVSAGSLRIAGVADLLLDALLLVARAGKSTVYLLDLENGAAPAVSVLSMLVAASGIQYDAGAASEPHYPSTQSNLGYVPEEG